jgi:hypothetical protein
LRRELLDLRPDDLFPALVARCRDEDLVAARDDEPRCRFGAGLAFFGTEECSTDRPCRLRPVGLDQYAAEISGVDDVIVELGELGGRLETGL